MASAVQGKDCVFKINITGGLKAVLCSKLFTLTTTTEEIETTTISDGSDPEAGYWKDFDYQNLSYSITLDGIMKITDASDDTAWELLTAQLGFYEVPFQLYYLDAEANSKTVEGTVMVKSSSFSAASSGFVNTSVELLGKGKYTIV
jgi:predicted secreted protein